MTLITENAARGFRRISVDNGVLRAQFLPELGGKMTSLVRLESGHEFLLQPQRPLRRAAYGDPFDVFDTSGFDDCVPTVCACGYPERGLFLPDHGELWSVPWQAEVDEDKLCMSARGKALPYRFSKTIRLDQSEVSIDYEIANEANEDLQFLWSAHPLLRVEPASRITLPGEVTELFVQYSLGDRLGAFGGTCPWPVAETRAGRARLDTLLPPTAGFADKLFTPRLRAGHCALYKPGANESIGFRFDAAKVPYIGLWMSQGGWPDRARSHYTIALEPCSGRPDSLSEAVARGEHDLLAAGSSKQWGVRVKLARGEIL